MIREPKTYAEWELLSIQHEIRFEEARRINNVTERMQVLLGLANDRDQLNRFAVKHLERTVREGERIIRRVRGYATLLFALLVLVIVAAVAGCDVSSTTQGSARAGLAGGPATVTEHAVQVPRAPFFAIEDCVDAGTHADACNPSLACAIDDDLAEAQAELDEATCVVDCHVEAIACLHAEHEYEGLCGQCELDAAVCRSACLGFEVP